MTGRIFVLVLKCRAKVMQDERKAKPKRIKNVNLFWISIHEGA